MRKRAFKALVGSHNYNLADEHSDKDYKEYYLPTFDDLYSNRDFSKAYSGNQDIERHDIRKLPEMLWKANVNFIEVLFSTEVQLDTNLYQELTEIRDDVARMNLPYLYDACMGMFLRKKKDFERDTSYVPMKIFIDKREEEKWNLRINKHAASAYRITDFLDRFRKNNFTNFFTAMHYSKPPFDADDEEDGELIRSIRKGEVPQSDLVKMLSEREEQCRLLNKDVYRTQLRDEKTKAKVDEIIKRHVWNNLIKEEK